MKYRVTWPYVSRIGRRWLFLARVIQRLCGWITGHEYSKYDRGYGGGLYEDRYCRWCNQYFAVPVPEGIEDLDSYEDFLWDIQKRG